ncbi:MAG: hypothetical protein C0467_16810 [Planctomycetaceae bacterium]|nr:hypothetical protein [Planctomycetaceae bacterium]
MATVFHTLFVVALIATSLPLVAAEPEPNRSPKRFAIVYNHGYAGDHLPKDREQFESLVKSVKSAHFNVILCQYEPWRAEICKKHDMKIFVDLLVPAHHVFKATDEAKKLCESLKNDDTVYGYHLWSDNITDATVAGRTRDVKNVHEWDPNHPAYVGATYMNRVSRVEGMDVFGYYDFHWKRGGHWDHLNRAMATAQTKKVGFLRYDDATSGVVGKGNSNRVGYTYATSIPFGLKGYIYHYTGGITDKKTFALDPLGEDLKKVNARFAVVGDELMKIGVPTAVYSTPITKTAKNDPTPAAVPGGLKEVPKDHWFRFIAGKVLVGEFTDPEKRNVLVFANHNPYESQEVKIEFGTEPKIIEFFDRVAKKWVALKIAAKTATVPVEDHGVELIRVTR